MVRDVWYTINMSEGPNLEQEIAALSVQIEEKRAELERERGSHVEGREALHTIVSQVLGTRSQVLAKPNTQYLATNTSSYLDDLDPADIEKVNALIDMIPKQGIKRTIDQARSEPAYILDAFHDALVDRLHDELKKQKLI